MKIENNFEGISNIVSSDIKEKTKSQTNSKINEERKNSKSDTVEVHSSKKLNGFNLKLRNIQENISKNQAYLKGLNQARKLLFKNKDVETLYVELIKAAHKYQFNKKSLLKNIIPSSKDFYKSVKNINKLKERLNNEIKSISNEINIAKKEMNKTMVSIENVKASFSGKELGNLKNLLNNNRLFNNMNKESIIALVK